MNNLIYSRQPETLHALILDELAKLPNRRGECVITVDLRELNPSENEHNDLACRLEMLVESRSRAGLRTDLQILVHSMRLGCESTISAAIQEPANDPIGRAFGALPEGTEVIQSLIRHAAANVATEKAILHLKDRYEYDVNPLLGKFAYGATGHRGSVEGVRIQLGDQMDGRPEYDVWLWSPVLPGVARMDMAGYKSEAGAKIHTQISLAHDARWNGKEPDPEPIVDPERFARQLYTIWLAYREQADLVSQGRW